MFYSYVYPVIKRIPIYHIEINYSQVYSNALYMWQIIYMYNRFIILNKHIEQNKKMTMLMTAADLGEF